MQLLQQKLLWLSAWCIYIINTSRFSFLSKFTFIYEIPRWLSGKESATNAEDMGLIPRLGRSLGKENGNLFQYSCLLGNPMDRGVWWAIINGIAKESDTT